MENPLPLLGIVILLITLEPAIVEGLVIHG